jgi:hypothetical protein
MGFCPKALIGQSDGVFFYSGISCPAGTSATASDTRAHRLGVDCTNVLDPIGACGEVEHVCGCHDEGLAKYVTLKEKFKPKKHARVVGQCTAVYKDGKHRRKVRLFVVRSQSPEDEGTVLRVGLELAPKTALPPEGCFQATLEHKKGCYHCIRLDGMDGHLFHVIIRKSPKGRAKRRPKRGS